MTYPRCSVCVSNIDYFFFNTMDIMLTKNILKVYKVLKCIHIDVYVKRITDNVFSTYETSFTYT